MNAHPPPRRGSGAWITGLALAPLAQIVAALACMLLLVTAVDGWPL